MYTVRHHIPLHWTASTDSSVNTAPMFISCRVQIKVTPRLYADLHYSVLSMRTTSMTYNADNDITQVLKKAGKKEDYTSHTYISTESYTTFCSYQVIIK